MGACATIARQKVANGRSSPTPIWPKDMMHLKTCDMALCGLSKDNNCKDGEEFIQANADLHRSGRKKLRETLEELGNNRPLARGKHEPGPATVIFRDGNPKRWGEIQVWQPQKLDIQ